MIQLVDPSTDYQTSYLKALAEFAAENRSLEYRGIQSDENFADYVKRIALFKKGIGLPEGYIPESVMWLVDGSEFIGEASIRHELTDFLRQVGGHIGYVIRPSKRKRGYGKQILKLSLQYIQTLGINSVLLTCDETNIGSAKIIEANGGILEDAVDMGEGNPRKLRYWIDLT
jgi:predicted acetyltransferase